MVHCFQCPQVREARAAAEKAQQLLQNVANRKTNKQLETGGLVITKAVYGNHKAFKERKETRDGDQLALQVLDVTVPLNFLVNDSGQLKVRFGSFMILLHEFQLYELMK